MSTVWFVISLALLWGCGDSDDEAKDGGPTTAQADAGAGPGARRLPPAEPAVWPMLAGSPSSTFHNPNETTIGLDNVDQLEVDWQVTTRGTATATPCIVGGRIYNLAAGEMMALNAETGEPLWKNGFVGGTSSPTCVDGVVYLHDSVGHVLALDWDTGRVLWDVTYSEHRDVSGYSSPVVADGLVLIGTSGNEETRATDAEPATFRGAVIAFDQEDGSEQWRTYLVDEDHNGATVWSTVSVDLDDKVVFVTTGNNYTGEATNTSDAILALDLGTGELMWTRQLHEGDVYTVANLFEQNEVGPDYDFGTNPILFEAQVGGSMTKLVGAGQKSGDFWTLDRTSGEVIWGTKLSEGFASVGGVLNNGAYDGERILVASNNATSDEPGSEEPRDPERATEFGSLAALDPATGDILWQRQIGAWLVSPITVMGQVGYVGSQKRIEAFDPATGEQLWTFETGGTLVSGAVVSGDRMYLNSGVNYLFGTKNDQFYGFKLPD